MKYESIQKIVGKLKFPKNAQVNINHNELDIEYPTYIILFSFKLKEVAISDLFQLEDWTVVISKFKTKDIQKIIDRFDKVYSNLTSFM
jgi:hypothetical protein